MGQSKSNKNVNSLEGKRKREREIGWEGERVSERTALKTKSRVPIYKYNIKIINNLSNS